MAHESREPKVRFNLTRLRGRLEAETGKRVSWADIAGDTKLHANTIYNVAYNRTRRVDLATLEELLGFFRGRGLDIGPGDLFELEDSK